jgi:NAD(P) transhydrogenase subunit alpha
MAAADLLARSRWTCLSSQANIAGYKAVVMAANEYGSFMPMLMTAAVPCKARGCSFSASGWPACRRLPPPSAGRGDRGLRRAPSVKDQVESLGAKWVDVPYANDEEKQDRRGRRRLRATDAAGMDGAPGGDHRRALQDVDILITTALIPAAGAEAHQGGHRRSDETGAVIVDLRVEQGGNVEGPKSTRSSHRNGVKIVGIANLPARVAADASALYARNVLNFLALSLNAKTGDFALAETTRSSGDLICDNGQVVPRS